LAQVPRPKDVNLASSFLIARDLSTAIFRRPTPEE
jgi:hypothetical protein